MECYPRRGVIPFETLSQGKDAVSRACPGFQGTEEALEDMRNFYKWTFGGHIRIRLRGASLHQEEQKTGEKVELVSTNGFDKYMLFFREEKSYWLYWNKNELPKICHK